MSLVLVGFGSSSKPHHRRTADYHAERLRERTDYGAVLTCYLLQNPAVECVRYGVSTDRAVAVPLFLARSEATEERVPTELELDRGGIEYAEPLGAHPGSPTPSRQRSSDGARSRSATSNSPRPSRRSAPKLDARSRPTGTAGVADPVEPTR
ncbi:sirohydrochlorin chelatase [Halosimplex aquaticum]